MKHKIKVVYIVPSLIKAGPINVVYNIVKHLDKTRFTPVIVSLSKHTLTHRSNKEWFEQLGVEIADCSYSKWSLQFRISYIAKEIQQRFDGPGTLFHAHGYFPALVLSKMRAANKLATIHNICDQDFVMKKGPLLGRYMVARYLDALKTMNLCVSVCNSMKTHYAAKGLIHLSTVYNGVDGNGITCDEMRLAARRDLKINVNQKVLFYPAGFTFGKNQKYIIDEIKCSRRSDLVVVFAGQGELESRCRKMAGDDPRFRFLGYRMDMTDAWNATDFLISSSLSEGMPMAVLEALLRGIPCILSKIPPHEELSERVFGSEQFVFDPHSKGSLTRLLENISNKSFQREEIYKQADKLFSSEVMCKGYEKIYTDLFNVQ